MRIDLKQDKFDLILLASGISLRESSSFLSGNAGSQSGLVCYFTIFSYR